MKYLLILGFILSVFSCSNEDTNIQISGNINGGKGKTLYISTSTTTDSVVIDSEDKFEFKSKTKYGDFYNVYFDKINPVLLYVDSGDVITFKSSFDNFSSNYSVEGSKVSQDIKLVQGKLNESFNLIKNIYSQSMTEVDSSKMDSVKNAVAIQSNKVVEEHRNYILNFIKSNPNSFAVLPAIYQSFDARSPIFSYLTDYQYYHMIDSALNSSFPTSKHAKEFHTQVIQLKQQYDPLINQKPKVNEGTSAPDFTVSTPDGKTISLSSFKGKYVLLDFWAAWCGPCRHENPNVVNAYRQFKSKNFTVFQVSLDKNKEDWLAAIEKDKLGDWPHGSDLQYWNSAPAKLYGVQSIPSNFLIDPQGNIIAQNLRGDDLISTLKGILK